MLKGKLEQGLFQEIKFWAASFQKALPMKKSLLILSHYLWLGFALPLIAQPQVTTLTEGLSQASSIDISTNGEIFVVETGKNRVIKLDLNGKVIDSFGGRGSGDYQFDRPGSIESTNGLKIYVTDEGNQRIQMYDNRYQFLGSYTSKSLSKHRFDPTFIGVDSFGNLLVYLESEHLLVRFGMMSRSDLEIGPLQQYGIQKISCFHVVKDQYFLADSDQGVLHRFSSQGAYMNFLSGFPEILAMTSDADHLYLLNSNTLFILDSRGNTLKTLSIDEAKYTGLAVWNGEVYLLTESRLSRFLLS